MTRTMRIVAGRCVLYVIASLWAARACALTHWAAMERAARIGRTNFSGALLLKILKLAVFGRRWNLRLVLARRFRQCSHALRRTFCGS